MEFFLIKSFPIWLLGVWYAVYITFIWRLHSRHNASNKKEEMQKIDTRMAYEIVE